eukprot:scaffold20218_cov109-Isochrysis_galbana.AAC.3
MPSFLPSHTLSPITNLHPTPPLPTPGSWRGPQRRQPNLEPLPPPQVVGEALKGSNATLTSSLTPRHHPTPPQVVGEALKGANLVASVMDSLGYDCNPPPGSAARTDIVQSVRLGDRKKVLYLVPREMVLYVVPQG